MTVLLIIAAALFGAIAVWAGWHLWKMLRNRGGGKDDGRPGPR
jgi:hypothetical protein